MPSPEQDPGKQEIKGEVDPPRPETRAADAEANVRNLAPHLVPARFSCPNPPLSVIYGRMQTRKRSPTSGQSTVDLMVFLRDSADEPTIQSLARPTKEGEGGGELRGVGSVV